MDIRLLVLRTVDIKALAEFYSLIGLSFEYHSHGGSPYHYSATMGQMVLEIYPLAKDQAQADRNLRLGFSIDNFDATIKLLREKGVQFSFEPAQTEFGFMGVIVDPDGRKIELYEK